MKKTVILALILFLFIFGCTSQVIEKPLETGETCNEQNCFENNFFECKESFGLLNPSEDTTIYYQIISEKNDKCEIYLELEKMNTLPEIVTGLNAKCNLTFDEMMQLQTEMNIEELDCSGPLYETIKQIKQFQRSDINE